MLDESRLTIEAAEDAEELEDLLREAAPDVGVSRNDGTVFVYGGSRSLVEDVVSPEIAAAGRLHPMASGRWMGETGCVDRAACG